MGNEIVQYNIDRKVLNILNNYKITGYNTGYEFVRRLILSIENSRWIDPLKEQRLLGGDNYPLKTVEELWRSGVPKYIKGGNIVKKLDSEFNYLEDMYEDSFFPSFLVDKLKLHIVNVVHFIEEGTHTKEENQEKLDEMTIAINELQNEFYENNSEIETFARDSIGLTVERILQYFEIDIDIEEALREREW